MVGLLEPRVGDDEPATVEHVVADQPVEEGEQVRPEFLRLRLELSERLRESVRRGHVRALEGAEHLGLVVPGDAQRGARRDHAHDESEHTRSVRAAIHQVADEGGGAPLRVPGTDRTSVIVQLELPAELGEQHSQLGDAAVHVSDDVERPGQVAAVVPGPFAHDLDRRDLLGTAQHVDAPEALAAHPAERAVQVPVLPADHVRGEVPVGPLRGALGGERLGHVEHDRVDQHVVRLGEHDELGAPGGLHVGGVDDGEQPAAQPGRGDVAEHVERIRCRGLVVLVVGD